MSFNVLSTSLLNTTLFSSKLSLSITPGFSQGVGLKPRNSPHHPLSVELSGLMMVIQQEKTFEKDKRNAEWAQRLGQPTQIFSRSEYQKLNNGPLSSDHYIFSAGVFTSKILQKLDARIPLQPAKDIIFAFRNASQPISHPTLLQDAHIAITPTIIYGCERGTL